MDKNDIDEWNKLNKKWFIICIFEMILFTWIGYSIGSYVPAT